MDILQQTYLRTIDPRTSYQDLFQNDVMFSIMIHALLFGMATSIVMEAELLRCIFVMAVIMSMGYVARLARSKALFKATNGNLKQTMDMMHKAYFQWYFLG